MRFIDMGAALSGYPSERDLLHGGVVLMPVSAQRALAKWFHGKRLTQAEHDALNDWFGEVYCDMA